MGLESTRLAENVDELELPPPDSSLEIEPTSLGEPATPLDRSAKPTHASRDKANVTDALELEVPKPRPTPLRTASLDFELTDALPAPKPREPKPRPEVKRATTPLDHLAVVESPVAKAPPAKPTKPAAAPLPPNAAAPPAPPAPPAPRITPPGLPDFDVLASVAETFEVDDDTPVDANDPAVSGAFDEISERVTEVDLDAVRIVQTPEQPAISLDDTPLDIVNQPLSTGDYEPVVVPTPSIARKLDRGRAARGRNCYVPMSRGAGELAAASPARRSDSRSGDRAGGLQRARSGDVGRRALRRSRLRVVAGRGDRASRAGVGEASPEARRVRVPHERPPASHRGVSRARRLAAALRIRRTSRASSTSACSISRPTSRARARRSTRSSPTPEPDGDAGRARSAPSQAARPLDANGARSGAADARPRWRTA